MSLKYSCEFCCLEESNDPVLPDYLMDINTAGINQGIIYRGVHYLVKPDISPIIENHLLIIPKEHVFCMNSSILKVYEGELKMVKQIIMDFCHGLGKGVLFFEHGCCSDKESGSSCIHHAHLHAIPVTAEQEKSVVCEVVKDLGVPISTTADVVGKEYLYLETERLGSMYWTDNARQSQFFRIVISRTIGDVKRSRWQNCLIDESEKEKSKKWLEKFEHLLL